MSPDTKKNKIDEIEKEKIKKLTPAQSFFTLIKGFICAGILYLPKNIQGGGWGFSALGLFASYCFTTACMFKLLEAKKASNGKSFKDIGIKCYGVPGRILVEVLLVVS